MAENIRVYINQPILLNQIIIVDEKIKHYLCNVMRRKIGDKIYIFNGNDGEFEAEILSVNKKNIQIIPKKLIKESEPLPDIFLVQAVIKRFDFVVEKATEIGASKIFPIITSRTSVKNINNERLNLIAKEAAEQSEALNVPLVEPLQKLEKILESWDKKRKLFCCFERNNEHNAVVKMSSYFKTFGKNAPCGVLIGPEGGFSDAEMQFLRKLSYVCEINLGEKILRAETAAIAALSLLSACKEI